MHYFSDLPTDLPYGALSLVIAENVNKYNNVQVVIVPDFATAYNLEQELGIFLKEQTQILHFADRETLIYDNLAIQADITSARLRTLNILPTLQTGIVIIPVTTSMYRLCSLDYVKKKVFFLKVGNNIDITKFKENLIHVGYDVVNIVEEPGQFVVRGSIIDIFPLGSEVPYRVDLLDVKVDLIRIFDVNTQQSIGVVKQIEILPATEYPLEQESIKCFCKKYCEQFGNINNNLYKNISKGKRILGMEYYLPLFFEKSASIFDFLPNNSVLLRISGYMEKMQEYMKNAHSRYEQYNVDKDHPLLMPEQILFSPAAIEQKISRFKYYNINLHKNLNDDKFTSIPDISIDYKNKKSMWKFDEFYAKYNLPVVICVSSQRRKKNFMEILQENQIKYKDINAWNEIGLGIHLFCGPLNLGFIIKYKCIVLTEAEFFPDRIVFKQAKAKKTNINYNLLDVYALEVNCLVVHIDHGVGRYCGLQNLVISDIENEFAVVEYSGNDKIYVPVTALHVLSKYNGNSLVNLDVLGGERWSKLKEKALRHLRDVASELLHVYAKRAIEEGFAHNKPDEQYEEFVASFPFVETVEQQQAIDSVINDMTQTKPMDRLICGDVGFGKTEVAMRAAFLAVKSKKQVIVLVPTTLLVMQHFTTFSDRYINFPIKIAMLSRLQNKQEQIDIIKKLKEHKVDIVIGTHILLKKDIQYKDLGLLIIDEEHRFGVEQKEYIKSLRGNIDILTLTATPIPRTLSFSMQGLRDLSIISTPPLQRLPVKTFVRPYTKALIIEAIQRELNRNGQVFFLHNNVETIEKRTQELANWLPTIRFRFAHGQMRERELEQIMFSFYHQKFDVLVCTTIIESGIDIPTANTIIIERADKIGLATLHQLRGRVGRSYHQAYAFCLIPEHITQDAQKRLEVLEMFNDLGSGFMLATHDLEIRGAGELLGDAQSGNMEALGYSLYMDLLNKAIKSLKAGILTAPEETANIDVDLQIPAFLSQEYIPDTHTRLVLYRRIFDADDLVKIRYELIDRFGKLPVVAEHLLQVAYIKQQARHLLIKKINVNNNCCTLEFYMKPNVNIDKLLELIKGNANMRLINGNKIKINDSFNTAKKRIDFVIEMLEKIK